MKSTSHFFVSTAPLIHEEHNSNAMPHRTGDNHIRATMLSRIKPTQASSKGILDGQEDNVAPGKKVNV
ncbi:unnamed protein product [Lactuca virosa]|uniref:Uncharacterized protein n=1 Tax=Lactuca virosa TaxID=75947 RepID=A0AAU9M4R9_9ASTR|nr:unnamed protein product [Lactuca virosa]